MLKRIFVFFLLMVLLNALVSCGGKKWLSADTAVKEQAKRQQDAVITSVLTVDQKFTFASPGASYDRLDRSVVGRTTDGSLMRVSIDSVQKFFIDKSSGQTAEGPQVLSKSMFVDRMKRTTVEPIYSARLLSDTNTLISFAPQYGRVWLFDSTLSGKTAQGEAINLPLSQVSSVKVSRVSSGNTLLFIGALAAVTVGVLAILWSTSDPVLKDLPPIDLR